MEKSVDASAISRQIKTRISELEEQLRNQQALNDELALLRRALPLLDAATRPRVRTARTRVKAPAPKQRAAEPKAAARSKPATARAPRGQNNAKILKALRDGPRTASDVSKATGIGRGTVSAAFTNMAKSGEIVKADRGYTLPT